MKLTMTFKLFLLSMVMNVCYSTSVDPRPRVKFPAEVTNKILEVINSCRAEYNVDSEVVDDIRNGKYRTDASFGDFIHCAYTKSGFAKKDGHLLVEEGEKIFPPEYNIGPVLRKCDSLTKGTNPSEITLSFFICFQKTSPVLMALST